MRILKQWIEVFWGFLSGCRCFVTALFEREFKGHTPHISVPAGIVSTFPLSRGETTCIANCSDFNRGVSLAIKLKKAKTRITAGFATKRYRNIIIKILPLVCLFPSSQSYSIPGNSSFGNLC